MVTARGYIPLMSVDRPHNPAEASVCLPAYRERNIDDDVKYTLVIGLDRLCRAAMVKIRCACGQTIAVYSVQIYHSSGHPARPKRTGALVGRRCGTVSIFTDLANARSSDFKAYSGTRV